MSVASRVLCVHQLFERQVRRAPHHIAVYYRQRTMTFGALNAAANGCARALRWHGVGPGGIVGVLGERTPELVAALIGVMKAGGAYLPLDPDHPADRQAQVIREAKIRLVVSERRRPAPAPGVVQVAVDWHDERADDDVTTVPPPIGPDDLAAVIYTSGSTGTPKGVMLPHRAIAARCAGGAQRFVPGAVRFQKSSITVVSHVSDLLLPLIAGVSIVIVDDDKRRDVVELARLAERRRIRLLNLVPSQLRAALRTKEALGVLRTFHTIVVAGEAATTALVEEFTAALPDVALVNSYGATETAGSVSSIALTRGAPVTIGHGGLPPRLYVLDDDSHIAEIGEVGEVCIRGPQLARGYLHRPTLTRAAFVPDPISGDGARMYRTGDLGRYLPDGRIEIVGRTDNQVKIMGFKINLEEVEAALLRHPAVQAAVALTAKTASGDTFLRAYVTRRAAAPACESAELTRHATALLPRHMVPAVVQFVDDLPHLPNGKIDRLNCRV